MPADIFFHNRHTDSKLVNRSIEASSLVIVADALVNVAVSSGSPQEWIEDPLETVLSMLLLNYSS